jgi:hypothetical protein
MSISRQALPSLVTARVSDYMCSIGALYPETRYVGRQAMLDNKGNVESGVIRTVCSFLTPSGLAREIDVPVAIYKGQIVEPSVGYFEGRMAVLDKKMVEAISLNGSVFARSQPGSMYSTAYLGKPEEFRALCDSMPSLPRVFRPIY